AARAAGERPVLDGAWLPDDALVASIGSTLPAQRELDVAALERCALLVADDPPEVLGNSGDGLAAAAAGVDLAARTRSLHELVAGALGAGARGPGVRVFKSVGSALQDLAVARGVLERALRLGLAVPTPVQLPKKER
ncbi:MAG TPA: hypothetical protein VHB30_11545, partial [Solirubrobacteraceae bacterium]|nr:hypothetical protein [Solirubrobacteraceae bacterium]